MRRPWDARCRLAVTATIHNQVGAEAVLALHNGEIEPEVARDSYWSVNHRLARNTGCSNILGVALFRASLRRGDQFPVESLDPQ